MKLRYALAEDCCKFQGLIEQIDGEFFPRISVQEGSIRDYSERLIGDGKVILAGEPEINGILGYFGNRDINCDLLWIAPEKRNTAVLFRLVELALTQEKDVEKVFAKTWSSNSKMINLLGKMGFELYQRLEADYVPERTSNVYVADAQKLKSRLLKEVRR